MSIVITVVGCLLGVVTYALLGLVTPIQHWGDYSTGILVALCLIWCAVVGTFPWPWFAHK
jgi:hypothetical protein